MRVLGSKWIARGCLALWGLLAMGTAALADEVKTDHVTAELVAERSAIQPGQQIQIGLRLQHQPHWHSYWRNPGDSGLPTTLGWTLPAGGRASEIQWPAPKRLPIGPLVNYGYEGEVLLPVTFTAPSMLFPGSTLTVRAQANWLVCKDVCIPENASLELRLPVVNRDTTPGNSLHAALFAKTSAETPVALAGWTAETERAGRDVLVTFKSTGEGKGGTARPPIQVFPYKEQVFEPARHEVFATPTGYAVKLRLMDGAEMPGALDGIAVSQTEPSLGAASVWGG
ncbi:MAG: putative ThiO:disulfide interchange protein, partial [Rhizobacter sp.]|nr:putative ThiO:disulfide interchange protein [Rhizobacter sp.]